MGVLKYKSGNSWISVPTIRGERGIQGEQGIQGPAGPNGVYVGATAPTDPDINVWIDTDEPGQTVVTSVNGRSGPVTVREAEVWTLLTKTYTTNSYVSETAFNRIYAYSNGEIVVFAINLNVDATPGATFRTIGQINLPSPLKSGVLLTVAGQSGGANLLIDIAYDTGVVQIYNAYGTATGWYRATAVMPLESAFE